MGVQFCIDVDAELLVVWEAVAQFVENGECSTEDLPARANADVATARRVLTRLDTLVARSAEKSVKKQGVIK